MSTWRLWMVSAGAVGVVGVIVLVLLLTTDSGAPEASAEPSATPTATVPGPAPTPTPSPVPTPSPTAHPLVDATCQDVLTEDYLAEVAASGRQVWDSSVLTIGVRPFDNFPAGAPLLQLVCRAGADPDLATDDVQDHAWARIHSESAVAAMQQLEADGYRRSDTTEGVYLSRVAEAGRGDADGWGETYLFTPTDVRWAHTRADLSAIRPADELL
ncbi:hypothetical protein P0L94_03385 [Microbacter sp. GSS18]|nr:hypothetical protein P0L94_03385 [Microbacter sp. GSS18]